MPVYPGEQAPTLELSTVDGSTVKLAEVAKDYDFTMLVFYRGSWCPICKGQVKEIEENFEKLAEANIKVIAISMDGKDGAVKFAQGVGAALATPTESIKTTVAYGLTKEEAQEWGLFLSPGREGTAEPAVFGEPATFVIKPDNTVYLINKQSAPFCRPSLEQLMGGLAFVKANGYPARGTMKE